MKAFLVATLAAVTLAGSSAGTEPMMTRYFRLSPAFTHNLPTDAAVINDGLETDDFTRSVDARPMV